MVWVVIARVESGVLGLFGLQGSNLLESSLLLVSLEMSVTVLMSYCLSSPVSGVVVSLSITNSSSSHLSGS